ncbi:hypothetical protein HAALTHF_41350n [Vreelandella aquamarina]|nr:hypothetical protein HAALTHF_41350n [Halomonas axialensis]
MGDAADDFPATVCQVIVRHAPDFDETTLEVVDSRNGRFQSVRVTIVATGGAAVEPTVQRAEGHWPRAHGGMTMSDDAPIALHRLGYRPYLPVWEAMRELTDTRDENTADQFWLVEHEPVFTQGQAGKPEHLLMPGDIPVVNTDRGGQVTYHGPGQVVLYPLLDVRRGKIGVRDLVTALENAVIDVLDAYGVRGWAKPDAPGFT